MKEPHNQQEEKTRSSFVVKLETIRNRHYPVSDINTIPVASVPRFVSEYNFNPQSVSRPFFLHPPPNWPLFPSAAASFYMNLMANRSATMMSSMQQGASGRKQRRERTTFTQKQSQTFENYFLMSAYPDIYTREKICRETNIDETRVLVWFKNRRAKAKAQKNARLKVENSRRKSPMKSASNSVPKSIPVVEESASSNVSYHQPMTTPKIVPPTQQSLTNPSIESPSIYRAPIGQSDSVRYHGVTGTTQPNKCFIPKISPADSEVPDEHLYHVDNSSVSYQKSFNSSNETSSYSPMDNNSNIYQGDGSVPSNETSLSHISPLNSDSSASYSNVNSPYHANSTLVYGSDCYNLEPPASTVSSGMPYAGQVPPPQSSGESISTDSAMVMPIYTSDAFYSNSIPQASTNSTVSPSPSTAPSTRSVHSNIAALNSEYGTSVNPHDRTKYNTTSSESPSARIPASASYHDYPQYTAGPSTSTNSSGSLGAWNGYSIPNNNRYPVPNSETGSYPRMTAPQFNRHYYDSGRSWSSPAQVFSGTANYTSNHYYNNSAGYPHSHVDYLYNSMHASASNSYGPGPPQNSLSCLYQMSHEASMR